MGFGGKLSLVLVLFGCGGEPAPAGRGPTPPGALVPGPDGGAMPGTPGQTTGTQTFGPQIGSVMLVGGGENSLATFRMLQQLGGGQGARVAYIPTANGGTADAVELTQDPGQIFGTANVALLHATTPAEANGAAMMQTLRASSAVWFATGRPSLLVETYRSGLVHAEILALLTRGGVVAGNAAGASAIGDFLVRGERSNDTNVFIGDVQKGLGLVTFAAFDPQTTQLDRSKDFLKLYNGVDPLPGADPLDRALFPEPKQILGIGLDERTALIIKGELAEVWSPDGKIAQRNAHIYDPPSWTAGTEAPLVLGSGDRYNIHTRQPITNTLSFLPDVELEPGDGAYVSGGGCMTGAGPASSALLVGLSLWLLGRRRKRRHL